MLLGERSSWLPGTPHGDDEAVVVAGRRGGRVVLLGRGDPARAVHHVAAAVAAGAPWVVDVGWMSLPRPVEVPQHLLASLGLVPFSTWDWLGTDRAPEPVAQEDAVRSLTPADAGAVRACLEVANRETSAEPTFTDTVRWWGVDGGDGRLVGAVQAVRRPGDPSRADRSWHLRGLAVHPERRGQGWGRALTAAATRQSLGPGTDWVSLVMYADNQPARRVYDAVGFTVEGVFASFGPAGATRPPG